MIKDRKLLTKVFFNEGNAAENSIKHWYTGGPANITDKVRNKYNYNSVNTMFCQFVNK